MRTIIAGSRSITSYAIVEHYIRQVTWEITVIISGKAKGVDTLAEVYAIRHHIPFEGYPVTKQEWETIGPSAGYKRNVRMADEGRTEALVVIWDGESKGTWHMITIVAERNLPILIFRV